jgi:hypothetical protein
MAGRANVRIASAKNFNAGRLIGWGFFLWKNGFGDGKIKFVTTNKNFKRLFFGVSVFFPKTFQKI